MDHADVVPGQDLASYLRSYPQAIAFAPEGPEAVFDRYHTPDLVMVTDGSRLDRRAIIAHATPARRRVTDVRVEVHDAVTGADRVAARYTLTAVLRKGSTVATEIVMIGHLAADGRLCHVDQLTRILPAADDPPDPVPG